MHTTVISMAFCRLESMRLHNRILYDLVADVSNAEGIVVHTVLRLGLEHKTSLIISAESNHDPILLSQLFEADLCQCSRHVAPLDLCQS